MRWKMLIAMVLVSSSAVSAQQAIQQPVVGTTSVNTTVSVPDRGRVFLGGTSSAQSGRSQYGPLRSGPSSGYSLQATSMSATVYIHDLHAMDEEILNSAPSVSDTRRFSPLDRSRGKGDELKSTARESHPVDAVPPLEKAAKFEQLARKADEAGKASVAKLHWQMAAKYGSKAADLHLAELNKAASQPPRLSKTAAR